MRIIKSLKSIRTFILDLDGVIYRGNKLRKGARNFIQLLDKENIEYHFLTNTSAISSEEISIKLKSFGINANKEKITTSSEVAAFYLKRHLGRGAIVFTLGGLDSLNQSLEKSGVKYISIENIRHGKLRSLQQKYKTRVPLLIGWTDNYDYDLASLVLHLRNAISDLYSTDNDACFSAQNGNFPGTGWVSGSIRSLLQKEPVCLGKPNPFCLNYVLNKIHKNPSESVCIGDNLYSDILVGNIVGCRTILLLGGATSKDELSKLEKSLKPSLIISELNDLFN